MFETGASAGVLWGGLPSCQPQRGGCALLSCITPVGVLVLLRLQAVFQTTNEGLGPLDRGGHWRRPLQRHKFCGLPGALCEGPTGAAWPPQADGCCPASSSIVPMHHELDVLDGLDSKCNSLCGIDPADEATVQL